MSLLGPVRFESNTRLTRPALKSPAGSLAKLSVPHSGSSQAVSPKLVPWPERAYIEKLPRPRLDQSDHRTCETPLLSTVTTGCDESPWLLLIGVMNGDQPPAGDHSR